MKTKKFLGPRYNIPKAILTAKKLSPLARLLWVLIDQQREPPLSLSLNRTWARVLASDEESVDEALSELMSKGYLKYE